MYGRRTGEGPCLWEVLPLFLQRADTLVSELGEKLIPELRGISNRSNASPPAPLSSASDVARTPWPTARLLRRHLRNPPNALRTCLWL